LIRISPPFIAQPDAALAQRSEPDNAAVNLDVKAEREGPGQRSSGSGGRQSERLRPLIDRRVKRFGAVAARPAANKAWQPGEQPGATEQDASLADRDRRSYPRRRRTITCY